MRKLNCPTYNHQTHLDTCVDGTTDVTINAFLASKKADISARYAEYLNKAPQIKFFEITPLLPTASETDRARLANNYAFMAARRSLRSVYDALMKLPKFFECPFCREATVSSIDHYLPKSVFGEYAVFVPNLVPACDHCNENCKKQHVPTTFTNQFYHPYFDDEPNEIYIEASTIVNAGVSLEYSVSPPATWDAPTVARARFNFTELKLAEKYKTRAGQSLSNMKGALISRNARGGAAAVQSHLKEELDSRETGHSGLNGWETVMLRSLVNSHAFVNGGFNLISL